MLARVLDLFSGISAPSVAWHPLGWETLAFAEIEKFPAAVLAHHYPDVPNLGDITKHSEWPDYEPDVIVGGSPCQAFSVAGLRKGLDDPRGNLTLTYLAVANQYRPRWVVWENVTGVLSIDGGRTFGAFLGGLAQLGYGFAYRVLDAQYAGVPQRRRRVFVVGHSDWRCAAAVLFERHSLSGHPAPRREAGEGIAGTLDASFGRLQGCSGQDANHGHSHLIAANTAIAPTIPSRSSAGGGLGTDFDLDGGLVARCVTTDEGNRQDYETTTLVAHSLRGEGYDASEDGTGRGTPLVPISFHPTQDPISGEVCHCLGANATAAVAFDLRGRNGGAMPEGPHDTANIRAATGGSSRSYVQLPTAVRRLTPTECERLQGFPDDYTAIPWRGKPADQCPDGPRYKALGNSMAVPVVRWIGERIAMVEQCC